METVVRRPFLALLFVCACDASAPPDAAPGDAAPLHDARADAAAADSGPPPFSLLFHDDRSNRLDPDDRLPVHVGCQGGSHVFVGVTVEDAPTPPTRVGLSFQLEGDAPGPTLTLAPEERRPGRWELRSVMLVFSDSPEIIDGSRPARLAARIDFADGEAFEGAVELRAVPGDVCDATCVYDDLLGDARVTEVSPADGAGCAPEDHRVAFDFEGDDGTVASAAVSIRVAPDCLTQLGLVEGGRVRAVRRQITSGTCAPVIWSLLLDESACAACP